MDPCGLECCVITNNKVVVLPTGHGPEGAVITAQVVDALLLLHFITGFNLYIKKRFEKCVT